MSYWTAIQNKIIFYKMNFYKFLSNFKGKQIPHVFPAINIRDAYEKAGRIIIDEYPNISDYSADILDTSNLDNWKRLYHQCLETFVRDELDQIQVTLNQYNPQIVPIRAIIETVWHHITTEDNWLPFYDLLAKIKE